MRSVINRRKHRHHHRRFRACFKPFSTPLFHLGASLTTAASFRMQIRQKRRTGSPTHRPATQEVTASPAAKHAAGSLSLFLQAMNASFTEAQETATCLDAAMSTAETGGAEEEEVETSLIVEFERGMEREQGE